MRFFGENRASLLGRCSVPVNPTDDTNAQSPEAVLFARAQAGCSATLNYLMARHDGLVQAVVRRQVLGDLPFKEALQAGRIGLWRAILGFDPQRGYAFSTYAWTSIARHIWRAVETYARQEPPLPLSPPVLPDPAVVWEEKAIQQTLAEMVNRLEPRLAYIVTARYGLDGRPPALYWEIGAALGVTRQRVAQLLAIALARLRHPAHSYRLRTLLGRHTVADYEQAAAATARQRKRTRRG